MVGAKVKNHSTNHIELLVLCNATSFCQKQQNSLRPGFVEVSTLPETNI